MLTGALYDINFYRFVAFLTMLVLVVGFLTFCINIRRTRRGITMGTAVLGLVLIAVIICSSLFGARNSIIESSLQKHYVFSSYIFSSGDTGAVAILGDGTTRTVTVDYSQGIDKAMLVETPQNGTAPDLPVSFYEKK